jgi:hypothetical protein
MSGYLLRLAGQSGMKLGRGMNSERPASPNVQPRPVSAAPLPSPDVVEQNVRIETSSLTAQSTHAPHAFAAPADSSTESLRTASADVSDRFSQNDPRSDVAPAIGSLDPNIPRDETYIDANSPSETKPKRDTESPHRVTTTLAGLTTPPRNSPAAREPTATEVIQEVMAWIASDSSPANTAPIEALASANPSSTPYSTASLPFEVNAASLSDTASVSQVPYQTARLLAVARESETGATSVHIGSIQLTIEAPPDASPRISSTPAPVAAPRTIGSRLRRHYLRPF